MRHTKSESQLFTLKLPKSLGEKVARIARRRRTTRSAIVREALERLEGTAIAGSALDVAGDLVGSLKGPGDLSSNPARLKGYGR